MFAPTGLVPFLGEGSILRKAKAGSLHRVVAAVPFEGSRGKNVRYTVEGFRDTMTHSHLEIQVTMGVVGVEMPVVPEQAPNDPGDLIRNHPATKANLTLVTSPVQDGAAGKKADLDRGWWETVAADPRTIVFRSEKAGTYRALVDAEPTSREEWSRTRHHLGHGGQGFALVELSGEERVTHNLWSPEPVPAAYAHLFTPTHAGYRELSDAEDEAYWAPYNPFAEEAA